MVDAGGRNQPSVDHLISYLEAFFARRADLHRKLNAIFVTHTHIDHDGALERVAGTFDVGGYVYNSLLNGSGSARMEVDGGAPCASSYPARRDQRR
jgi:competence protein ComEC